MSTGGEVRISRLWAMPTRTNQWTPAKVISGAEETGLQSPSIVHRILIHLYGLVMPQVTLGSLRNGSASVAVPGGTLGGYFSAPRMHFSREPRL